MNNYTGPYFIVGKVNDQVFKIAKFPHSRQYTVPIDRLKDFKYTDLFSKLFAGPDIDQNIAQTAPKPTGSAQNVPALPSPKGKSQNENPTLPAPPSAIHNATPATPTGKVHKEPRQRITLPTALPTMPPPAQAPIPPPPQVKPARPTKAQQSQSNLSRFNAPTLTNQELANTSQQLRQQKKRHLSETATASSKKTATALVQPRRSSLIPPPSSTRPGPANSRPTTAASKPMPVPKPSLITRAATNAATALNLGPMTRRGARESNIKIPDGRTPRHPPEYKRKK